MRKMNYVTGLKACPLCEETEILCHATSITGDGSVWCSLCSFGVTREVWEGGILQARSEWNEEDFGKGVDPDE